MMLWLICTWKSSYGSKSNWAWGQVNGVDSNVVAESDIKYLPIILAYLVKKTKVYVLVQKTILRLTVKLMKQNNKLP